MNRLSLRTCTALAVFLITVPVLSQSTLWKQIDAFYGGSVRDFAFVKNGDIYTATDGGVFKSIDHGGSWRYMNIGNSSFNTMGAITVLPSGEIIACADFGIYRSTDNGATWTASSLAFDVRAMIVDTSGRIYAGCYNMGIKVSDDRGKTWTPFALNNVAVIGMHRTRTHKWIVLAWNGVYLSGDEGKTWNFHNTVEQYYSNMCETSDGTVFARSSYHVYRSDNAGETWISIPGINNNAYGLYVDTKDRLFLCTNYGVLLSSDKGTTWEPTSLTSSSFGTFAQDADGKYYAGSLTSGVSTSPDGKVWTQSIAGMTASTAHLLCSTPSGILFASYYDGVQVSRDDGTTWKKVDLRGHTSTGCAVANSRGDIFLSYWGGVMRSSDDGATWTDLPVNGGPNYIGQLLRSKTDILYAGTSIGEVFRSVDNGTTWVKVLTTDGSQWGITMAVKDDGTVFYAAKNKVLRSKDNGTTWQEAGGSSDGFITALQCASDGSVLASTANDGVLISHDDGASWTSSRPPPWYTSNFSIDANGYIYAPNYHTIYQSIDNGRSWSDIGSGIDAFVITSVNTTSKGYLFAGTQYHGMYRTIAPMVIGPQSDRTTITQNDEFSLWQNYPNPFNAETKIEFTLNTGATVDLIVYDYLGREVTRLAHGTLEAGRHIYSWDANAYAAGVYYYTLRTGANMATKRLIVLK
jgi:hypothetical protein